MLNRHNCMTTAVYLLSNAYKFYNIMSTFFLELMVKQMLSWTDTCISDQIRRKLDVGKLTVHCTLNVLILSFMLCSFSTLDREETVLTTLSTHILAIN